MINRFKFFFGLRKLTFLRVCLSDRGQTTMEIMKLQAQQKIRSKRILHVAHPRLVYQNLYLIAIIIK